MRCRLCNDDKLFLYYTQGNQGQYKFFKCRKCKLINYDLSAGQDQLKYTGWRYIHPDEKQHKQNIDQANTFYFIRRRLKRPGKLLDIGCGNGKLLVMARDYGWEVKGLELSESLAVNIRQMFGIEVAVANFLTYENPHDTSRYDVVILRHVLEHLPDSILAMTKIYDLLNPNGHAVMEFPDIESLNCKIKRFLSRVGIRRKKYKEAYKPGHCNEFSRQSFNYLLNATGFKLLEWQYYSSKPFMSVLYQILPIGSKVRVLIVKKGNG